MVGNDNTSPIILYYIYQYEGGSHVGLHKMY